MSAPDPLGIYAHATPAPAAAKPTDDPLGIHTLTPHPETLPSHITPQENAQYEKTSHQVSKPVQKFVDAIQRTSQAGTAFSARGPRQGLSTLIHGETPEQYQADTHAQAKKAAEFFTNSDHLTEAQYNALPGWLHNILEIGTQTAEDPLTYIGGLGLAKKGVEEATVHALPLAVRAGTKLATKPGIAGLAGRAASHYGAIAHDIITPGGHEAAEAARTLALKHGAAGVRTYQRLYALRNAALAQGADVSHSLQTAFDAALHGVAPDDQLKIFKAIHSGTIDKLPDTLQPTAKRIVQVDRSIAYLGGSKALRNKLTKAGFKLPPEFARHDIAKARGVVRTNNFRTNHIPLPHELEPSERDAVLNRIETGTRGKKNTASTVNLQFKPRRPEDPDSRIYPVDDPALIRELFGSSFKRAGRQIAGADLQNRVAELASPERTILARLSPTAASKVQSLKNLNAARLRAKPIVPEEIERLAPSVRSVIEGPEAPTRLVRTGKRFKDAPAEVRQFFTKAAEKAPDTARAKEGARLKQEIGGQARNLSDLGRSTLFTTPFPHQTRIASLLALHSLSRPDTMVNALKNYARLRAGLPLFGATPEREAAVLGMARRAGSTGIPNVEQGKLIRVLQNMHVPAPVLKKFPFLKGAEIAPRIAAKWYEGVGKSLWSWDDAAKAALFQQNLQHYKDPLLAAYHTQQSLVDYGVSSPLTEGARTVSSFPTWRTRMPVAVVKGLAENPHNAALLARLASALGIGPAAAYGGSFEAFGKQRKETASAPAEGLQAFLDPQAYLRGTLSPTGKLAAYALSNMFGRDAYPDYWTYEQTPASFVAHSLPVVNQLSTFAGKGMFASTPGDEALYNLTGLSPITETMTGPFAHALASAKARHGRALRGLEKQRKAIDASAMSDAQKAQYAQQITQAEAALNANFAKQVQFIRSAQEQYQSQSKRKASAQP